MAVEVGRTRNQRKRDHDLCLSLQVHHHQGTGSPQATILKLGRGSETPKSGLGGGAHLVGWAIK